MKAVILAAGKSTRTYPLTLTRPKPLLMVGNKTIMESNLDSIREFVDEAIIVAGYKKDMLVESVGFEYKGLKISFVEQKEQLGTAHALSLAEDMINNGRFILMLGDNLYSKDDIKKCLAYGNSILAAKVKDFKNYGVLVEKEGVILDIVEKPKTFVSDRIVAGVYVFNKSIFSYAKRIKKSSRGELELPDAIKSFIKNERLHCIESSDWFPVAYPQDLLRADIAIRHGENLIGNGALIEGEVVNSNIGRGCIIKGVVKNSIIMHGTTVEKDSIVEHSIIGERVYFSGRANSNNRIGAYIGDAVRALNVDITPGCKIWPYKKISGCIKKDVN